MDVTAVDVRESILSSSTRPATSHKGSSISWSSLKAFAGKKEILTGATGEGIAGHLKGGSFCAIMGPSGAGKSTLLNALAGRIKGVSGTVLYGGQAWSRTQMRGRIAYVLQEDVLCGTQTPREALTFSAALRLPRAMPFEEKRALVDQTLQELGLERCADSLIGDGVLRGISGGEKKRTSIGVELVVQPQILFLDEPTSGLDSYAAYSVVHNLQALSQGGCTVLCTIHQPSSEIFHLFRDVLLLQLGKTFFFGRAGEMDAALARHGHATPPSTNPADHVMFLLQTLEQPTLDELAAQLLEPYHAAAAAPDASGQGAAAGGTPAAVDVLGASVCTQIAYLAQREYNTFKRDRPALIAMVLAPLLLNLLFALIFFQAGDRSRSTFSVMTQFGAITQIMIGGMFGSSQPLLLKFPLEAALFKREYSAGSYSSAVYFLSKTVVELPKSFCTAALTWLSSYYIMALSGPIIYYILTLWLMGTAAASTALLIGCLSSNVEVAIQASPAIFVPQILFAGFFIQSSQIPAALRWLQYLCSLRYGINILLIVAFAPPTTDDWSPEDRMAAEAILNGNDIDPDDLYVNVLILVGLIVGFRLVGIVALARRAKVGAF